MFRTSAADGLAAVHASPCEHGVELLAGGVLYGLKYIRVGAAVTAGGPKDVLLVARLVPALREVVAHAVDPRVLPAERQPYAAPARDRKYSGDEFVGVLARLVDLRPFARPSCGVDLRVDVAAEPVCLGFTSPEGGECRADGSDCCCAGQDEDLTAPECHWHHKTPQCIAQYGPNSYTIFIYIKQ